jgi:hypothetical protein
MVKSQITKILEVKTHEKFGGAFSLGREAAFIAAPISSGAFESEVIAGCCTLMS